MNVIHLVGRASLFLDLLNVLLNLFDLLIESLLVGVNDMMALLESHCLLVQIDAKGYPEHSDQSLHQEKEQLAVPNQDVVSRIPVFDVIFLLQNLKISAKHSVDGGRVMLELLIEWSQQNVHSHSPREEQENYSNAVN